MVSPGRFTACLWASGSHRGTAPKGVTDWEGVGVRLLPGWIMGTVARMGCCSEAQRNRSVRLGKRDMDLSMFKVIDNLEAASRLGHLVWYLTQGSWRGKFQN